MCQHLPLLVETAEQTLPVYFRLTVGLFQTHLRVFVFSAHSMIHFWGEMLKADFWLVSNKKLPTANTAIPKFLGKGSKAD